MSEKTVQGFYGKWATFYDFLTQRLIGIPGARRTLAESLELGDEERVVEMGCGTGANFGYVVNELGDGELLGIDITRGMLRRAQRRVRRKNWDNIQLVQGDATDPPFDPDYGFDVIYATFVMGMFENPGETVESWVERYEPRKVVLMDAERTPRWHSVVTNQFFKAFVFASAPNRRSLPKTLAESLEERNQDARDVLEGKAERIEEERHAAGLVRLTKAEL